MFTSVSIFQKVFPFAVIIVTNDITLKKVRTNLLLSYQKVTISVSRRQICVPLRGCRQETITSHVAYFFFLGKKGISHYNQNVTFYFKLLE